MNKSSVKHTNEKESIMRDEMFDGALDETLADLQGAGSDSNPGSPPVSLTLPQGRAAMAHSRKQASPKPWEQDGAPVAPKVVIRWPGNRRFPRLYEACARPGEETERARCRAGSSCTRLATYPDLACFIHTAWLEGGAGERTRADHWREGDPEAAQARRFAWESWRAMQAPSMGVPALPAKRPTVAERCGTECDRTGSADFYGEDFS